MGPRKRVLRAIAAPRTSEPLATEDAPEVPLAGRTPARLAEKILSARASIEGERKQVTILFADVKGSTDLVQHMDAEDVSTLLDPLQKIMIDAVHTYEGTVNEVLGDGIMAIFGAPIAHEDHALRACRAALDMQEAAREWAERNAPDSPAGVIQLRVGLNSGEVVVRAINNDLTISYSAMGMTTHLAARMEQSAEPGAIQISGDTHRLVSGLVDAPSGGEITVKGVSQPVSVFELRGLGAARTRLEAATLAGLTRFVGREHEMRVLEERFAEAEAGHGQVVSIVGDPGIGKSRLLLEFRARLANRATWVEGHSVSFGQSMAFHPLIGLLRRNFRVDEHDAADAVRAKIAAAVERIGPGLEPALPHLFYMLGAAEADDPVHALDPQIRRAETFDALRQLLLRAAERKPQALAFEDLHWSDTATREFLTYLLDSIPRARALILLTFRPGYDVAMGERTYASQLALHNLSEAESAKLAEAALASEDLPDELHALIRRKAEGNPFFVEEVIKALGETGAIRREGERWVLGRPLDQIVVPDTIQDVLMSRIDRLDDEPRRALQLAAVIGREFTQRLLERIAEIRIGTTAVLRDLQAIELIYEKALFPELAYMFKHALTQDVAYGSLLNQRRRELHQRIGAAIEEVYADRLAEHYAVLGYHFARGEDWPRAANYFELAADHAAAAFAIHEALALCEEAIDALGKTPDTDAVARSKADLHARKAGLYMAQSDFVRAHAAHERAEALARQLDDPERQGSALAGKALASLYAHEFQRCFEESRRAMAIGRAAGSEEIVAAGQWAAGFGQALTGHLDAGRDNLEQAHALSSAQGAAAHHAMSAWGLAFVDNWQGEYGSAVLKAEEAAELSRHHNLAFSSVVASMALGLSLAGRGNYDRGLSVFNQGLALAEKIGEEFHRNRLINCIGWIQAECGNLACAMEYNGTSAKLSGERGDVEARSNAELNIADLSHMQNDDHLALKHLEGVHGIVRKPSTSDWMKWRYSQHLFASLGEAWLASDDPAKSDNFCDQCLELATRTGSKKYLVRGWRLKGGIAMARLQWQEAEEALRKALELANNVGNPTQLWKTHLALGQLCRDTRRAKQARTSFAAARNVIEGIGGSLRNPELKEGFERSSLIREVLEQCRVS